MSEGRGANLSVILVFTDIISNGAKYGFKYFVLQYVGTQQNIFSV